MARTRLEDQDNLTPTANKAAAYTSPADSKKTDDASVYWRNMFLLEIVNNSQTNTFTRSEEAQQEIERAYEVYKTEIAKLDTMDRAERDQYLSQHPEIEAAIYGGTGRAYTGPNNGGSTQSFRDIGKVSVGERQREVMSVIDDAAAATGVNVKTMRGIWYNETRFSQGGQVSSTGCSGPFQFSRGTWGETILKHGDEIAQRLQARGMTEDAAKIYKAHLDLRQQRIRPSDAGLQAMRFDGEIATYAAAYYAKDIAQRARFDANDPSNGGMIYAGFNVGEGNLRRMRNGQGIGAREANVNFGQVSLADYQAKIANGDHQYGNAFGDGSAVRVAANAGHGKPHHEKVLARAFDDAHRNVTPLARNNNNADHGVVAQVSQVASNAVQGAASLAQRGLKAVGLDFNWG